MSGERDLDSNSRHPDLKEGVDSRWHLGLLLRHLKIVNKYDYLKTQLCTQLKQLSNNPALFSQLLVQNE